LDQLRVSFVAWEWLAAVQTELGAVPVNGGLAVGINIESAQAIVLSDETTFQMPH
jgi:hypothetical protein